MQREMRLKRKHGDSDLYGVCRTILRRKSSPASPDFLGEKLVPFARITVSPGKIHESCWENDLVLSFQKASSPWQKQVTPKACIPFPPISPWNMAIWGVQIFICWR